jgi:DNA replicative helicase MCM subunit Mcm2 (Cdc46/Mcm family)
MDADASFIITTNPRGGTYDEGKKKIKSFDIPDHVLDRVDLAVRVDPYNSEAFGGDLEDREDSIQNSLETLLVEDDTEARKKELSDYLSIVREIEPQITKEAIREISKSVVRCEKEFERTSGRLQDSIVNISTAIAKANMCDEVKSEHVEKATEFYVDCWNSMM